MAHFKEKSDALILQVDATATPADVERWVSLPDSPRLIVQGETLTSVTWMISIEGQVVLSPHSNFVAGLATSFVSFYSFNLEYQEEALCMLEFIQRFPSPDCWIVLPAPCSAAVFVGLILFCQCF